MSILRPLQRSVGRKLLAAVGLPSLLVAVAGGAWLRAQAGPVDPEHERVVGLAILGLMLFAALMALLHLIAVRVLLEAPLKRLSAAMRRAQAGDFLHRVEVRGQDELAELARTFNTTLAAVTDLHAARIDDAASLRAMEREVALKAQLEERVRELELLHRLAETLASTLDVEALCRGVAGLAAQRSPDLPFVMLLADPVAGDLVVRSAAPRTELVGLRLPPGATLAGRAAATGEVQLAEGAALAEGWLPGDPPPPAAVAVPMRSAESCLGVLLFGLPSLARYDEREARLIGSAARSIGTAVANARLHQAMVRLSQTDNLTGVQNRRQLFARLELERERAVRFGEPFGMLLIDVDHFRQLNEAVGHAVGDGVLRQVASLLAREARSVDMVARYGGEEFALVMPRSSPAEALATGERLRAAVAGTAFDGAPQGRVTISIGVACFPSDAQDLGALADCADAALFAAKRAGRNAILAHAPGQRSDPARKRDQRTSGEA